MKKVLLITLLLITSLYSRYDNEQNLPVTYWVKPTGEVQGTGTQTNPFVFRLGIPWDLITGEDVTLIFTQGIYTTTGDEYFTIPDDKISQNLTIINADGAMVTFNGNGVYDLGIIIRRNFSNSEPLQNILIKGISFENFIQNAIKIQGVQLPNLTYNIGNVKIEECSFSSIIGSTVLTTSSAAIIIQMVNNIELTKNMINEVSTTWSQTDGIFLSEVGSSIKILNNEINVQNNNSATPPAHIDCIQLNNINDVIIEGNKIYNSSELMQNGAPFYEHRQGIMIELPTGTIKIKNNFISSEQGNNLINVHLNTGLDSLQIYNNTIVGKENQDQLLYIAEDDPTDIKIFDNILYKEGSLANSKMSAIKFDPITPSSSILQNNLYFNKNGGTSKVRIYYGGSGTSWLFWDFFDLTGLSADPLLSATGTGGIGYFSPAKNRGKWFWDIGDDGIGNNRPNWKKDAVDIGAFEIPDAQIKIGVINTNTENSSIYHQISACSPVWEFANSQFQLSSDPNITSSTYNSNGDDNINSEYLKYLKGFSFKWLHQGITDTNKPAGIGFYKVTVSDNSDFFFYLDTRSWYENENFNPVIYLKYNSQFGQKKYEYYRNNIWQSIENKTIVNAWDVRGEIQNTQFFPNFWVNSLAGVKHESHPLIAWCKYSTNEFTVEGYNIYRKYETGNFSLLTTVDENVTSYLDPSIILFSYPDPLISVQYYVKAILIPQKGEEQGMESQATNTATFYTSPYKTNSDFKSTDYGYTLFQNYPNPFNPVTEIKYTIQEKGNVSIKVFNYIGEEVLTLLNRNQDGGEHSVIFDASNLSSGIYFYTLQVNDFRETKKMVLLK